MRIGRVSSREAARGHLDDGLDERRARDVEPLVAVRLRQRREVLEAQRADVERRRAGDELDVLLGGAQLERELVGRAARGRRRGAGAPGSTTAPSRDDLALERDAQADLHVGGAQLDARRPAPGSGRRRAPARRCAWTRRG